MNEESSRLYSVPVLLLVLVILLAVLDFIITGSVYAVGRTSVTKFSGFPGLIISVSYSVASVGLLFCGVKLFRNSHSGSDLSVLNGSLLIALLIYFSGLIYAGFGHA